MDPQGLCVGIDLGRYNIIAGYCEGSVPHVLDSRPCIITCDEVGTLFGGKSVSEVLLWSPSMVLRNLTDLLGLNMNQTVAVCAHQKLPRPTAVDLNQEPQFALTSNLTPASADGLPIAPTAHSALRVLMEEIRNDVRHKLSLSALPDKSVLVVAVSSRLSQEARDSIELAGKEALFHECYCIDSSVAGILGCSVKDEDLLTFRNRTCVLVCNGGSQGVTMAKFDIRNERIVTLSLDKITGVATDLVSGDLLSSVVLAKLQRQVDAEAAKWPQQVVWTVESNDRLGLAAAAAVEKLATSPFHSFSFPVKLKDGSTRNLDLSIKSEDVREQFTSVGMKLSEAISNVARNAGTEMAVLPVGGLFGQRTILGPVMNSADFFVNARLSGQFQECIPLGASVAAWLKMAYPTVFEDLQHGQFDIHLVRRLLLPPGKVDPITVYVRSGNPIVEEKRYGARMICQRCGITEVNAQVVITFPSNNTAGMAVEFTSQLPSQSVTLPRSPHIRLTVERGQNGGVPFVYLTSVILDAGFKHGSGPLKFATCIALTTADVETFYSLLKDLGILMRFTYGLEEFRVSRRPKTTGTSTKPENVDDQARVKHFIERMVADLDC